MNLSAEYLGLSLRSPIVIGASPVSDNVDTAQQVQDAGCGAIVMRSLFEEQIYRDAVGSDASIYQLSPAQYLKQLGALKAVLTIPVIASLNGCRPGEWIDYARRFQEAGADALEINFYQMPADIRRSAQEIEAELMEVVALTRATTELPIAIKLSPFYTSLAHLISEMEDAGVAGVVLFNRLYQPDFDFADRKEQREIPLSESSELHLRLRWTSLLNASVRGSIAITGGVNRAEDVIKSILVGADVVQVVSAVLKNGPGFVATLCGGLRDWMKHEGYQQFADFHGAMAAARDVDPSDAQRSAYQRMLQLWRN